MDDERFLELFRALDEPFADLKQRLAALEKKPARAEVAGAVEVVAGLPAAGQAGRLLYQSTAPAGLYADNGTGWAGPLRDAPPLVAARASRSSSQSLPNDATTIVNFDAVDFDTAGGITTGATWAYTAQAAGTYLVAATVTHGSSANWAIGETLRLELHKNDSLYARLAMDSNISANTPVTVMGATLVELAAGDKVDIRVYQNSGGTLTISGATGHTHVSLHKA